jgi:putative DNA primase/helicase
MNVTTAAEVIKALGGRQHDGMCRCPAHDDKNPSLHVSSDRNGKVLYHCFAGCSQQQVLAALKARGINPSRKTPETTFNPQPHKSERGERREKFREQARPILWSAMRAEKIGRYDYKTQTPTEYLHNRGLDSVPPCAMLLTRENAAALGNRIHGFKPYPAMVCPIVGPKGLQGVSVTFLTRDATKNLRSTNDNKNIRRIYGARKGGYVQLGLIDPDNPPYIVVVAEGIETALSASQLTGHPAIAVLGANNFVSITPPQCGELIIAADNNKVGRDAAQAAAEQWAATGRKVRIAVPNQHMDWNDAHRDSNADRDQLAQMILEAEVVTATKERMNIRALSMEEVLAMEIPPPEFLMEPWLWTGCLAMIQAKRGVGKTRFAMAVCHAVATGEQFLPWKVERKAPTLFVDGELPTFLLQKRIRELGSPTDNLRFVSRDILLSGNVTLPDLGQPEGREFLDRIIEQHQSKVIWLDSLSTLIRSGVENEAESWAPVQDWLLKHRFRGRSIIFLHHEGRSGQARGTSKREDVLDTVIRLEEKGEASDGETTLKLTFTKKREFYGVQAEPLVLHLKTSDGTAEWSFETDRDATRERVKEMAKEGAKQSDIAKECGISQATVSRIIAEAA